MLFIMSVSLIFRKCFLLLFFYCVVISSKKISSRETDKLSDCRRCKILTESFNHWLDKTSRGKYEGGDAAWEEKKLKSYSRSEIRLTEIQEGLCSELMAHQNPCYSLAEDVEQVLENWWFHEDPHSSDLYTWLCIETLRYCCPKNHYGYECTVCPLNENNKVCSGYGKCDGDGTRKGNGTCMCNIGYTGLICGECDTNFFPSDTGTCESCHKSCNGCSNKGPHSCRECALGWKLESGMCVDIDECSLPVCKPTEYCVNTDGSYNCRQCHLSCKSCIGEGPNDCTSCELPNILWFGECIDNYQKQNIITTTYKRLSLYVGLLAITLFIFRTSKSIASLIVLVIAIFIYFSEKAVKINTMNVLLDLWSNSNRFSNNSE